MIRIISLAALFSLLFSCIKTAEQVRREKHVDSLSSQMGDTQGLVADMVARTKSLQDQLNTLNGKIEELEYLQSQITSDDIKKMSEDFSLLKTQQEAQNNQLLLIQEQLQEQKSFMEKITKTLEKISKTSAPLAQKKSAKKSLSAGLKLIKNDQFKKARSVLETLIDHKDLTAGQKNKVLHGLGKVEFYTKNYEKALVYFSKIVTRYPRSSIAPSSFLFIGKSLSRMGKKEEAKEAFLKVISDYKDSKEANEARKNL